MVGEIFGFFQLEGLFGALVVVGQILLRDQFFADVVADEINQGGGDFDDSICSFVPVRGQFWNRVVGFDRRSQAEICFPLGSIALILSKTRGWRKEHFAV